MRILHLVSYSLYSGPLPPTLALACAQRELGHDVWLAHDSVRGAFNSYEESGDSHVEAAQLAPPCTLALCAKSSPLEMTRDVRKLRTLLNDGVDVLHVHLSHDHTLAVCATWPGFSGKLIRTLHAERSLLKRFGQKQLLRQANGWIVRHDDHRRRLIKLTGAFSSRVATIRGAINTDYFKPATPEAKAAARSHFGIPEDAQVIGHTALMAGRGQEELIQAAQKLNDASLHLMFVGRGEAEKEVHQLAKDSGISDRIHFTGYLQGPKLLEGYHAMDGAFSAQPGNDASARAVLEAMSCALPVIGVEVGAIAEAVVHLAGFPIASRDPEHIAEGLAAFLKRPRGVGERAREKMVHEHSVKREADWTLAHYETC